MGWALHLHLIAAIAWIGGAFFMFVLGITLREKENQDAVYPRVGPIYGYYETGALVLLLVTGTYMVYHYGFDTALLDFNVHNRVIDALRIKLVIVAVIVVLTVIHTVISFATLNKEKTPRQKFLSKVSSMGIFILNLFVLHYAMVIRDIL